MLVINVGVPLLCILNIVTVLALYILNEGTVPMSGVRCSTLAILQEEKEQNHLEDPPGPINEPQNDPCKADFRRSLVK